MPASLSYHPLHAEGIMVIWETRALKLRQLQLAARKLGNVQLDERIGDMWHTTLRRIQGLHAMHIDYRIHKPYYIPNPIDWNYGQPSLVSTLKPVEVIVTNSTI